jgi:hypothetical protein
MTDIYDGVFIVTSAVCVNGRLSIFDNDTRLKQTIQTVESIKQRCPNSMIYVIDVSSEVGYEKYLEELSKTGATVLFVGNNEQIRDLSKRGMRSHSEISAILLFLDWFKNNGVKAKRVYKVSGRYELTDSFNLGLEHENSFVILKSIDTWMDAESQKRTGISKMYEGRLYHMDYSLLSVYESMLMDMFDLCVFSGIDIEHALYHTFQKHRVVEVDMIGIRGYVAPSGEYKDQ